MRGPLPLIADFVKKSTVLDVSISDGKGTEVSNEPEAPDEELGLEEYFAAEPDDQGLSLDALSKAYADLIDSGEDPYEAIPDSADPSTFQTNDDDQAEEEEYEELDEDEEQEEEEIACEVSPQSIVEAMLFVGNPANESLTNDRIASFMRGVRPQEVDGLVVELNTQYETEGCPYRIESHGSGYRMVLCEEFGSIRDRFYGQVKAAKLSQQAIDVLAIVAYRQPLTREQVEQMRGRPSGALLSQLVRRQLLQMARPQEKPRSPQYTTTQRFLELFGLESVNDLPRSPDE